MKKIFNIKNVQPDRVKEDEIPCHYSKNIVTYMNRKDVKEALHVNPNIEWKECNLDLNVKYGRVQDVFFAYDLILSSKVKVLIYSGDIDMAVPTISTLDALKTLKLDIIEKWRPWYNMNTHQTAGFVTKYKGLTFSTIRGAGHMVPTDKPEEFYMMVDSFLNGSDLPR